MNYQRTHHCNQLRSEDIESPVTLSGWVDRRRDHGGLIFIDLRDREGKTQLVFNPETDPEAHGLAGSLRSEWVIAIEGKVIARAEGMTNPSMATGAIEVRVTQLSILSKAKTPPFSICDDRTEVSEEIRLQYRYLDLRRPHLQKNLHLRHQAMTSIRNTLNHHRFCEIQTPILGKSTPEGARDYLVPSRIHPATFYALPQSPQIFKQLLMIGGMERYYQIAPCFRDEDLRADRQPEFTQIDLEMSFETPDTLFSLMEKMMAALFKDCLDIEIETPFLRLPHREAIARFGSDKPDLRFGMELIDLNDLAEQSTFSVFLDQLQKGGIVKGLCVKKGSDLSRKAVEKYTEFVGRLGIKGLAWMKKNEEGLQSNIVKFFPDAIQQALIQRMNIETGDLIFMIADTPDRTHQGLDHLRRLLAKDRSLIPPNTYAFRWITEFPLFSWNPLERKLESEHHPFTGVHPQDEELLESDPLKVRSMAYDLVLNGYELGSGSQRIHDQDFQKKLFQVLRLSEQEIQSRFGFFIEALQFGTPPHLGIGIGFDRVIMLLSGTDNIRDVIAFPKTQKASDVMMQAPSTVASEQIEELHLTLADDLLV